jgi:shikimate dehydrogenase
MTDPLRFALFGHPVGHSLSPAMHGAALRALGLPHTYEPLDVPGDAALAAAVAELRAGRLAGANVTLPHKRAVLELVDEVAASAAEAGAANVLRRAAGGVLVAHNTDVEALARELGALCGSEPPARALVLGAGGAGFAAIVACLRAGARSVVVTTRSWASARAAADAPAASRARALGAAVAPWPSAGGPSLAAAGEAFDLVVQATSAGMTGAGPGEAVVDAVPWRALAPHARAYDVVYTPAVTPFLASARARGLRAEGGLGMLVHQAVLSWSLWLGREAPFEVMRAAAERALADREVRR